MAKKKLSIGSLLLSILSVLAVSLYPAVFLYTQNAAEASLSDIASPALYFACGGLGIFALLWLFTRKHKHAAIATCITMLALLNYSSIESLMCMISDELRYWHCLTILIVLLVHIIVLIAKKLNDEWAGYVNGILAGVFSLLIVMNSAMAVPSIMNKMEAERELAAQRAAMQAQQKESDEYLPNIYFIILDEYSGYNTLKKIYGYDNDPFLTQLESLGFTVSRDSYNETYDTLYVTANLVNLSYDAKYGITTGAELDSMRQHGTMFQILSEHGYQFRGVGSDSYMYGLERADMAEQEDSNAKTLNGETIETLLYLNTCLYPFYSSATSASGQQDILISFDYLSDPENIPQSSTFTMMHVVFPHQPFIFDANGSPVAYENSFNWGDKSFYLNQLLYCNDLTEDLVTALVANDPNAIIILQSDHGARASGDPDLFMKLIPVEDMKNVLNAVYLSGESFEIMQGHSGVNTLRLLMNELFGCNFNTLEVPNG